ncbi:MAG: sulfite exporter TauE/SafE family protein [Loktanella sp.]|jgi:uncharacterized protein|nr:sulfite exporter TauE/SafE family protein [Loktanella sp.]MDO7607408.1 sulfite exporter TauE/SafE family protein [Loktanella sp.]MDO7623058.1 sulfite exporter TauE/SafE family protein [Loktanella sp.]MDO7625442.1 sulfite exporter TauE/SafE family protein [Loktanella sp.]MDO7666598.1 sulfite exporter TauE/SafE family protein [Loktanella sp.]
MEALYTFTELTATQFWLLGAISTLAGVVRGFSGFALSAIVMASAVTFLPPVQLIPICFWLELCASILMAKSGWQEADRKIVFGLVIGSAVGVPIGLALTTNIPVDASKLIVLILVMVLALTQLAKIRIPFFATKAGLYTAGLSAGIASGLASVGGMVVALFVLSQDAPARKMRAALALFLFISMATSIIYLFVFGVMTTTATARAATFALPCFIGVFIGQRLFTPKFETYYRPFCLTLLTGLALAGLIRTSLS